MGLTVVFAPIAKLKILCTTQIWGGGIVRIAVNLKRLKT